MAVVSFRTNLQMAENSIVIWGPGHQEVTPKCPRRSKGCAMAGRPFKVLDEGDLFLFKLKAARGGRIVGGTLMS